MIRPAALLLLLLPLLTACTTGDLVLNEFVASNATGHTDESGAYPDWIEIHDPTAFSINLSGHAISHDSTRPERQRGDESSSRIMHLSNWAERGVPPLNMKR